ncbi:hypothetical protein BZA77DRAFT_149123 [Pyronema omphalodes]|nr:hypothetical protein BZA77DRAFT_149123 [Pyronema omphalodes]
MKTSSLITIALASSAFAAPISPSEQKNSNVQASNSPDTPSNWGGWKFPELPSAPFKRSSPIPDPSVNVPTFNDPLNAAVPAQKRNSELPPPLNQIPGSVNPAEFTGPMPPTPPIVDDLIQNGLAGPGGEFTAPTEPVGPAQKRDSGLPPPLNQIPGSVNPAEFTGPMPPTPPIVDDLIQNGLAGPGGEFTAPTEPVGPAQKRDSGLPPPLNQIPGSVNPAEFTGPMPPTPPIVDDLIQNGLAGPGGEFTAPTEPFAPAQKRNSELPPPLNQIGQPVNPAELPNTIIPPTALNILPGEPVGNAPVAQDDAPRDGEVQSEDFARDSVGRIKSNAVYALNDFRTTAKSAIDSVAFRP